MNTDKQGRGHVVEVGTMVHFTSIIRVHLCSSVVGGVLFALTLLLAFSAGAQDDPFGYLEDANDPRTRQFFQEQGAAARAKLDAIPGRGELLARIRQLSGAAATVSSIALTPTRVFYLKLEPGRMQPALYVREGLDGAERELLDPAGLDREGRRAAIDWFVPSPDGRHVAYGVSTGGSEESVLRVLAVDTRRDLGIELDRARFNRDLAWDPAGRSFYYARIPAANPAARRYAHVRIYRHVLGRDARQDEIVFAGGAGGARDVPEQARPSLHVPTDSRYAYAVVRDGVRREIAVHATEQRLLAAGRPAWRKIAGHE